MSPFTEHYAIRFLSAHLHLTALILQFDSLTGYSVCTNRCNIRCGLGSFLSMVTSHLLAVPNTESTNCYNLWLVCLRHLQPLARHSLSFHLGLRINLRLLSPASFPRLRHKFFLNSGSSLRLLDFYFGRPSSDLEVIASVFLGASLIILGGYGVRNIAEDTK
jgi:hypothetical protein